jgi:hypothetical protein
VVIVFCQKGDNLMVYQSESKNIGVKALKALEVELAIKSLKKHLESCPQDIEAELELGIAYLLNGDEDRFMTIHQSIAPEVENHNLNEGRLGSIWALSLKMFARVAQAAAIVTLVTMPLLSGCSKKTEETNSKDNTTPVMGSMAIMKSPETPMLPKPVVKKDDGVNKPMVNKPPPLPGDQQPADQQATVMDSSMKPVVKPKPMRPATKYGAIKRPIIKKPVINRKKYGLAPRPRLRYGGGRRPVILD